MKASDVKPGQRFRCYTATQYLMLECCDYAAAIKGIDGLSDDGRVAVDLDTATLVCFQGDDEVQVVP